MLLYAVPPRGGRTQFDQVKRREVITLLGGAAATWRLAARAGMRLQRLDLQFAIP